MGLAGLRDEGSSLSLLGKYEVSGPYNIHSQVVDKDEHTRQAHILVFCLVWALSAWDVCVY